MSTSAPECGQFPSKGPFVLCQPLCPCLCLLPCCRVVLCSGALWWGLCSGGWHAADCVRGATWGAWPVSAAAAAPTPHWQTARVAGATPAAQCSRALGSRCCIS